LKGEVKIDGMASSFNRNPWLINTYDTICAKNGVHILKLVARGSSTMGPEQQTKEMCLK
jgi:hypothetical protein